MRLVGRYRCWLRQNDADWDRIVRGQPEAWVIAVHEAAELDAFAKAGVNPFDREQWREHFDESHLQAVRFEMQFLEMWASQISITLSEWAIEQSNPYRKQFPQTQRRVIGQLAARLNWSEPDDAEIAAAEQFWQRILSEDRP